MSPYIQNKIDYLKQLHLDCGDNSCRFAFIKGGMRTNGGCRCMRNEPDKVQRFAIIAKEIVQELDNETTKSR